MLRSILFVILFTVEAAASSLNTSPLDQPAAQTASDLFEDGDFVNLDQYLDGLRAAQARDESGYLELSHAYLRFWGHGLNVNLAQNAQLDIEAHLQRWRQENPASVGAVTATAIYLAQHAKTRSPGTASQQDAISEALNFINLNQNIGASDPFWSATHLEVLALQDTGSEQFDRIFEQAKGKDLPPFPLYIGAGLYLKRHAPKALLPFIQQAEDAKPGLSSRLYTYFAPLQGAPMPETWDVLTPSYKTVLSDYPSDWNRQSLAKAACEFGDYEEAAKHIQKLPWLDLLDLWGHPEAPQSCRDTILEKAYWTCEEAMTTACMTVEPRVSALERVLIIGVATFLGSFLVNWLVTKKRMSKAPRITHADVAALVSAHKATKLARACVENTGQAPTRDVQSRLGGLPSCDADHDYWPITAETGLPMLFLAQINLSDMPELQDFPNHGVLQIFAGIEQDGHLVNTDDVDGFELRYLPDPQDGHKLALPFQLLDLGQGAALSPDAIQTGRHIKFEPDVAFANLHNEPLAPLWQDWSNRLPEDDTVRQDMDALLSSDELESDAAPAHWVGGHPDFIQGDVRDEPEWRDMDRVILHLGFDKDVCLGDAGMLNVMIKQEDLRKGAFDKAICIWDCG